MGPWAKTPRRSQYVRIFCIAAAGLLGLCLLSYSLSDMFLGMEIQRLSPYESTPQKVFTVSQPDSSNSLFWDYDVYNKEELGMRPDQTYHSAKIKSPLFQVNTWKPRSSEGSPYFFMTPAITNQPSSVQMFSRKDLSLVYSNFGDFEATNNFRMQMYNGRQYLTFWEGSPASGHGQGHGVMYDDKYQLAYNLSINTLRTKADSHEFQLTEDGGALLTAYETIRDYDMSPVGGPVDGVLQDSCFEEIDIETGETRFTWRASDWFSITDCPIGYNDESDYGHPTHGDGWDFFHINSLEKTRDGNYLVVGRRVNVVVLINGTSGAPIWQVGGKHNDFADLSDGMATNFGFQHHARFDNEANTDIVMFDNAELANKQPNPACKERCSRGLQIHLDFEEKTAKVVKQFYHPYSVQARAEGSADRQANGNMLLGWGKVPAFTEYSQDGEVLLDVQTGPWRGSIMGDAHVYRIFSMDWKGYPTWDPAVAMHEGNAYVSWNGATELTYWALVSTLCATTLNKLLTSQFTGNSTEELEPQYVVYRGGFETKLPLPAGSVYARVAALDEKGSLLGSTPLVDVNSGEVTKMEEPLELDFTLA